MSVFEQFWKRELDIEDVAVLSATLDAAGIDASGFTDYVEGEGRAALQALQSDAETAGVFGVPSYVVDGELFWGAERLERARERMGL